MQVSWLNTFASAKVPITHTHTHTHTHIHILTQIKLLKKLSKRKERKNLKGRGATLSTQSTWSSVCLRALVLPPFFSLTTPRVGFIYALGCCELHMAVSNADLSTVLQNRTQQTFPIKVLRQSILDFGATWCLLSKAPTQLCPHRVVEVAINNV